MGLKTTDFKIESMQTTLAQAYAVIRKISVNGEQGIATFAIHEDRERALDINIKPYHIENIRFIVERDINDRVTAYNAAVTPYQTIEYDDFTHRDQEVTKYPFFYGWEQDIVSEE